jgi:archaellum biogenesis protein FlaJ (TadC family)
LYRYPYYLVNSQKKELENEIRTSIKHLSALKDKDMDVKDVLLVLQKLEFNYILTKDCTKILSTSDLNRNLRGTLEYVCGHTYSELEYDFFKKLIDVLDGRKELPQIVEDFLESLEQSIKEKNEQRKSKINLLFQINIFLFFLVFILLFSIFLTPFYIEDIKTLLLGIAIVFPIIEFVLIIVLNK